MSQIDTSVPHPARRYNYWLGGKDHFAADRASGDAIAEAFPIVVELARANRAFQRRCVGFLAEQGVRQFLDIGTGLPAPGNVHEVAQQVAPESRVVYVDNDAVVMTHARALIRCHSRGRTAYLEADVCDPGSILHHPALLDTLDLRQPVGLLLVAVLHFVHDDDTAGRAVRELIAALPAGSYVVVSHGTMDFSTPEGMDTYDKMFAAGGTDVKARTAEMLLDWFSGLEIISPGLVPVNDWRPDDPGELETRDLNIYAAVGRVTNRAGSRP